MVNNLYVVRGTQAVKPIVNKIEPNMFTSGENSQQLYYAFRIDSTTELVQIIRNKRENHWFGMYMSDAEDICRLIPVYGSADPEEMLERICNWYNEGKQWVEEAPLPEVKISKISKSLLEMEGMFGKQPHESLKRVQAYLNKPSVERWNDICGMLVDGETTIWGLLIDIDPSFPKSGRTKDVTGLIVEEWERIPTPLEILRAIKQGRKSND